MRTIKLYGHLGKKFGRVHRFDVRTPAEAVSALCANFPEFKPHVLEHNEPGYRVLVGKQDRSAVEELILPADNSISFIPVTVGSGGNFGRIVLGAFLIWVAPYAAGYLYSTTALSIGTVTTISTAVAAVGASLVLGGVAGILYKPPKVQARDGEKDKGSTNFNGPLNLSTQGNPVPLAYGKVMVGSQVISANIVTSKKIYPPTAITMTSPAAQNIYGRAYVSALMAGTDDAAGKVSKFKVTALPSTGTLYLNDTLTTPVVLNQVIDTGVIYNSGNSRFTEIWSPFSARLYGIDIDLKGKYIRPLFYKPAAGVTAGTASFTYTAIDDDGAESKAASSTIKWVTIQDTSDVQEWGN